MSFPNSRYSSSPAALQRDYAILQASNYHSLGETSEEEEEQEEERESNLASSSVLEDDEIDSHLSNSRDNLSELSLPGVEGEQSTGGSNRKPLTSTSKSKDKKIHNQSNHQVTSPPTLRATLSQSSSELSRSRGGGGSSSAGFLHRSTSSSFSTSQKRDFPNYLLGGDPIAPPKEADLRSPDEIEEERVRLEEREQHQQGHGEEEEDWEDNDETPMPNRKAWLDSETNGNGNGNGNGNHLRPKIQKRSSKISLGTQETSALLPHGSSHPNGPNESGFSNYSHGGGGRVRTFSHGGGAHPSTSGWNNSEPMPPRVEVSLLWESRLGSEKSIIIHHMLWQKGSSTDPFPPLCLFWSPKQVSAIANDTTSNPARREAYVLFLYSLPIWGTHILELSLSMASVLSLGHLGTIPLAAASLSSMTANVTGYSM